MRKFTIDSVELTDQTSSMARPPCPPLVIAEVGNNHQGDLGIAEKMILQAYECGVSAVKTQMRDNKTLYTKAFYSRPYESRNSYGKTYGEHREFLELDFKDHEYLKKLAEELGLIYFITPFDFPSLWNCERLNVRLYKVASGDLRSLPFLREIGQTGKPVILSTGGGTLEEIDRALNAIGHDNVCILHCTAIYPAPADKVNLLCIQTLRERYPTHIIGLSDHYNGIVMASAAYCFGARVFENHFTLDHTMRGTDHAFSLQPDGMKRLVRDLYRIHEAWGDGIKRRLPEEEDALRKMGKGVYAVRDIQPGETITEDCVMLQSPDDGMGAAKWDVIIGRPALCVIHEGSAITERMLGGNITLHPASCTMKGKAVL